MSINHNNDDPLVHAAVRVGDLLTVQQLIDAGNIDELLQRGSFGDTALHFAIRQEQFEIFALLLRATRTLCNATNCLGQTPCHLAATASDERFIDALLVGAQRCVELSCKDNDGVTPCHLAAINANVAVLASLLTAKVDVDARDSRHGRTPLHWATRSGSHEQVALLLEFGADAAIADQLRTTPFHEAAMRSDERLLRELCCPSRAVQVHGDVNLRNGMGQTPLMLAASNARAEVLAVALEAPGANVSACDNDSRTAAHLAAGNSSALPMQMLIARGADVNARDKLMQTPLLEAARFGFAPVVAVLVDAGADLSAVDSFGFGVCRFAARNRRSEVLDLLVARGVDCNGPPGSHTPLHLAALAVNPDTMRILIDAGADLNARDRDGFTPLHTAARARDIGVFRLLLESGADVHAVNETAMATMCHCAVGHGGGEIIVALYRAGADLDAPNKLGRTPLIAAAGAHDGGDALVALVALGVRAHECPMNQVIYLPNAGLTYLAGGIVDGAVSASNVAAATERVAAFQLSLLRPIAFNVCVGLHSLEMNALQMCTILEFALWPGELLVPFHTLWAFATTVKHFRR
jgi:ankyrin repeat protein